MLTVLVSQLLALPEENDTLESIGDIVEEEMAVTSQVSMFYVVQL